MRVKTIIVRHTKDIVDIILTTKEEVIIFYKGQRVEGRFCENVIFELTVSEFASPRIVDNLRFRVEKLVQCGDSFVMIRTETSRLMKWMKVEKK